MSLILLVEQEGRLAEQIRDALTAEGWQVAVVGDLDSARSVAVSDAPDLVLVGGLEGGPELAGELSSNGGGPGSLALVAPGTTPPAGADGSVETPFTDQQLRSAVRQCLARLKRAAAQSAAEEAASVGAQLTSQELFGDVLAEVEREVAAQAPSSRSPAPRGPSGLDEVERQLEETLSGVLAITRPAERPREPQTSRGRSAADAGVDAGVDALLSQTLSGMGVMRRPRSTPAVPVAEPLGAGRAAEPDLEPPPPSAPAGEPPSAGVGEEPPSPAAGAPSASRQPPGAGAEAAMEPSAAGVAAAAAVPPPQESEAGRSGPFPAPPPVETAPAGPAGLPRQFGQYTLLERVAVGGMAEVWKARMRGVEGFQKTVAIKKILPQLTDSIDFVTMFIDEAKLAAQLNHPHIIHIYDLGKLEDDYYIAMEYVEGKDLRSILNAARERGQVLPLGLALLVASRLASALDHAHRKRDFDDRELGLVHRDVSPQNVLISYEGDIKLCDFGIVKAVAKASKTQMGALKGKLQYMSPEQAWGRVVDARSDIFSLGAVLFEMLTGRRLFAGDTEISVLEAVRDGRIQTPRELDPSVPAEVEAVVLRALAREPDDRFESAGELQQAIEAILYEAKPTPSQTDLARFMTGLYAAERAGTPVGDGPAGEAAALSAAATGSSTRQAPAVAPAPGFPAAEPERRGPVALWAAVIAVVLLGGAALGYRLLGGGVEPVAPEPVVATVSLVEPVAATEAGRSDEADGEAAAEEVREPDTAINVEGLVDAQLKAREDELRRQFEEERRRLERELQQVEAVAEPRPLPAAEPAVTPEPSPPRAEAASQPAVSGDGVAAAIPEPTPAAPPATLVADPDPAEEPWVAAPSPMAERNVEPAPPAAGVREGDEVQLGVAGLIPPVLVSIDKPEYPALAKRLRVQGTVVVGVLVDETGRVAEARLIQEVPQNVGINEAALKAARTARFNPATKDGVRVKVWFNLTIPFRL
jgi:TonB family protein